VPEPAEGELPPHPAASAMTANAAGTAAMRREGDERTDRIGVIAGVLWATVDGRHF
jgi:hypothetical protein